VVGSGARGDDEAGYDGGGEEEKDGSGWHGVGITSGPARKCPASEEEPSPQPSP
jgi:hypothetical protein